MRYNQYLLYFNSDEFKKIQSVDINFQPVRAPSFCAQSGKDGSSITPNLRPVDCRSGPGITGFRRETMLPRFDSGRTGGYGRIVQRQVDCGY